MLGPSDSRVPGGVASMKASAPASRSANVWRSASESLISRTTERLLRLALMNVRLRSGSSDVAGEWREVAVGVAAGGFDLDDVRAQITEPTGGVGGGNIAVLDDP